MWRQLSKTQKIITLATATTATASFAYYMKDKLNTDNVYKRTIRIQEQTSTLPSLLITKNKAFAEALQEQQQQQDRDFWNVPSREEMIQKLKDKNQEPYDLLIVGGGATGAGISVDAATRGLKVAMVERDDFASGTSSRSTKLVHGGVRYLQKAIMELDYEQYALVCEALHERKIFLDIAPHLSDQLPIMLPVYKWWQVPYYWFGCKLYDIFAGRESLESSYFLTRSKALEAFPMLKNDELVGALVYYDGQHNDARMNVALAMTAICYGATVANHCEVIDLTKDNEGNINGAKLRDNISGDEWDVKAKGVINATGPFTDSLRKMDDAQNMDIVAPSAGVHIILPNYYSPRNMGLLDPATSDGRVIFFLPWQGNTIAGTTDSPTEVTQNPMPKEDEINWILNEVSHYLSPDVKVRRSDVLAAWSGIRPLVRDPNAKNTESLVRNHMINVSENKLITIAGGKWTTYRAMAEETVNKAIEVFNLNPKQKCQTEHIQLIGSKGYNDTMFIRLVQEYGMDTEVAQHLARSYGNRAWEVASINDSTSMTWPKYGNRISHNYPYIEAEIRYVVRQELACTAVDVLARRTRLAFLNANAALQALPKVIQIMSEELKWDETRQKEELKQASIFLTSMGLSEDKIKHFFVETK